MPASLILVSLTQIAASVSFALVAWALARRSARDDRDASVVRSFAAGWAAMSLYMLQRGALGLLANAGGATVSILATARFVDIVLVCVAAWGIAYYVGFLYTGWRPLRLVIGAYFVVLGSLYMAATVAAGADRILVTEWAVGVEPATLHLDAIYVAFGTPMLVATALYVSLAARPVRAIQRYRILLVSLSLLAWIGSGLAASIAGDSFWAFLAITGIGIATALSVFFAYYPPRFVLKRWDPQVLEGDGRRDADIGSSRPGARLAPFFGWLSNEVRRFGHSTAAKA